jgi:superfamily I DNA/RNA helicase
VLARNVYLLRRDVEPLLRAQGVVYETSTGRSSLDLTALEAAESWTRLGKGEEITVAAARKMYEFLPANTGVRRGYKKLPQLDGSDDTVSGAELAQFGGLVTSLAQPWHEALSRIAPEDVGYMRAARRRGERLRSRPRVRVSTIHSAKGGEADHVVLLTEMASRTYREMERNPDDERRVFYVGVTRARRKLTVVDAKEGRYCPWI